MNEEFAALNKKLEAFGPVELHVLDKKGRRFGTGLEITKYDELMCQMIKKSSFRPESARPRHARAAAAVNHILKCK